MGRAASQPLFSETFVVFDRVFKRRIELLHFFFSLLDFLFRVVLWVRGAIGVNFLWRAFWASSPDGAAASWALIVVNHGQISGIRLFVNYNVKICPLQSKQEGRAAHHKPPAPTQHTIEIYLRPSYLAASWLSRI